MRYITGKHALNLPCMLDTCGDWHTSALRWEDIHFKESTESIFGDYGIESNHIIPEHDGLFYVANTLRALLDLLDEGMFCIAQGAKDEYICNDVYTNEFMSHVILLRNSVHWGKIDTFMKKEYLFEWDRFKERNYV